MKVSFKWYDLWIGVYIDTKERIVYICPIPTIVIEIWFDFWKFRNFKLKNNP